MTLQILSKLSIFAIRMLVDWKCFKSSMLLFMMQLFAGYEEYVFRMISRDQVKMRSSVQVPKAPIALSLLTPGSPKVPKALIALSLLTPGSAQVPNDPIILSLLTPGSAQVPNDPIALSLLTPGFLKLKYLLLF